MIVGHFGGGGPLFGNLLHLQKYIGGAEGFVAYSGLVLGMISSRRNTWEQRAALNAKVARRAVQIACIQYLIAVGALAINAATGRLDFVPSLEELGGWQQAGWMILTLRFQPDFLNILPIYVIFLLCAPVPVTLIQRGYTGLCLAASVSLYLWAQWSPSLLRIVDLRFSEEAFRLAAWQLLFVTGLCLGYHRRKIANEVWPAWKRWILPFCLCCYGSVFLLEAADKLHLFGWDPISPAIEAAWFSRPSLRIGRLLAFASANLLAYLLIRRLRARGLLARSLQWLITLGTHSLYCFLAHFILLLALLSLQFNKLSPGLRDVAIVLVVITIYSMAKHRILRSVIPN
jgi:hypothetical protein